MIRNSILVAALAVLLSLALHGTGMVALFDPGAGPTEEAEPETTDSAAFEDFVDEALQPEEPEPAPEVEPLEVIEPDASNDIQVASDDPQETLAPDSGSEPENVGEVEPIEDVIGAAPPTQGTDSPVPQGTPEATPQTVTEANEAQEIIEAQDVETPAKPVEADAPELALEAVDETGDVEAAEAEEALASAVTRSLRPPPSRPSEDTFGAEEGTEDATEQPGLASQLFETQRTGIDLLAEAGSSALYGRPSLDQARATGNAAETNYRGQVFQKLNRSLRVHRNEKGFAMLRFQILPNGQVGWVRIIRSGGSPNINIAAAANVRSAAPFPRPPEGKPVEISVTFQSR